ncbi:MAG: ArsR family transcriptional regulator [Candidatus Lindowbacteria bacterium]|nr:ArsR family transcriptional regulator [Candidatus Lindowbacteria bacterium]
MGTLPETDSLAKSLFGKTRRAVLSLLLTHSDEAFYVRQIARACGAGLGAVQRELKNLTDAGIIQRAVRGNSVYYQANRDCPVFPELKNLLIKTTGVADVLRTALAPLKRHIRMAFLYGSFARGNERRGSDVDVLVVGDVSFADVVTALNAAQTALQREINPTVYSRDEFSAKLANRKHFLNSLLKDKKVFLIGNERDLARLAENSCNSHNSSHS